MSESLSAAEPLPGMPVAPDQAPGPDGTREWLSGLSAPQRTLAEAIFRILGTTGCGCVSLAQVKAIMSFADGYASCVGEEIARSGKWPWPPRKAMAG